jgi:LacI family transcriptional regulator
VELIRKGFGHLQRTRVTRNDVAKAAGVSPALVSIVMRDVPGASAETRERVLRIAAELGYRPDANARSLRQARSLQLGVVFAPDAAGHSELLEFIYAAAERRGYEVLLSATSQSRPVTRAFEDVLAYRCEGAIFMPADANDVAAFESVDRPPTVTIGRIAGDAALCWDDASGLARAVEHLSDLGHQHTLYVVEAEDKSTELTVAFSEALSTTGVVGSVVEIASGPWSGADIVRTILETSPTPTAVIASSDLLAITVIDAARVHGWRVPDDLSVVGFGNSRAATFPSVSLTTIARDNPAMAAAAVEVVADMIEGADHWTRRRTVPTELVTRLTTSRVTRSQPSRLS